MGVTRATRGNRRIATLLALAIAVASTSLAAAAQSGSEAVVCVGSEIRTLQTNPIRRIYTEDMEVVYRIGVDIGQRAEVERTLRSELGSYPEVWCAWSDPGDDHAVIISYTGVIREDLTVDPEDPKFQAFSVGFGTGFDEAETRATTIDRRFNSQSDGSGYEVLLRETWSERALAAGGAAVPSVPDGRICAEDYSPESCWMELADRPGCYLWNPFPQENVTVSWSRGCSGGFAQGSGRVSWYQNDEPIQILETRLQDGRSDGPTVIRDGDGALLSEGTYVNGDRSGTWTVQLDGGGWGEGPYVNGERHGIWTEYHADGWRTWVVPWAEGKRQGTATSFWEDGRIREVGPYVNDERHGNWTESYDDGGRGEGPYANGERHGNWTLFYEDRADNLVREVGPSVNGERHGVWTGYGQSGNRLGTVRFENGRPVGGAGGVVEAGAAATVNSLQLLSPAARSPPRRVS